jgi:hypothetical protein
MASGADRDEAGTGGRVVYSGEPSQGMSLDMFVWHIGDILHYKAKKAKEEVTPIHAYKEVQRHLKPPALAVGMLHHKQNKDRLLAYQAKVAPGFTMTFAAASAPTPRPGSGGSRAGSLTADFGLEELDPPLTAEERRREREEREEMRRDHREWSEERVAREVREFTLGRRYEEERERQRAAQQRREREVPHPGDLVVQREEEADEDFRGRMRTWAEQLAAHYTWREAETRAEHAAQTPARFDRPRVRLPGGTPSSASAARPAPWEDVAEEWNPFEELIELLRMHFETPTAEKIEAFNRFTRAAGESAMTAASRFTEICAVADTIDNRMQVEKWVSTLDPVVAEAVARDSRFRAGDKHAPLQVIIKITHEEERWRALRKGVQLSLPGSKKEGSNDRREKAVDGDKGKEFAKGWRNKKDEKKKGGGRFKDFGGSSGGASFTATPAQMATASRGCFICGGDHLKKNCPKLGQDMKCFNCGKMGHMAMACNSSKANGKPSSGNGGGNRQKMRSPSQAPGGTAPAAPAMQASTGTVATSSASTSSAQPSTLEQMMARLARLEGKQQAMAASTSEDLSMAMPASSAFYEGRHFSAAVAFKADQWQEGKAEGVVDSQPAMVVTRQHTKQAAEPRGAASEQDAQRGELRRQTRLPQSFQPKDLVGGHLPSTGPSVISRHPIVNADNRCRSVTFQGDSSTQPKASHGSSRVLTDLHGSPRVFTDLHGSSRVFTDLHGQQPEPRAGSEEGEEPATGPAEAQWRQTATRREVAETTQGLGMGEADGLDELKAEMVSWLRIQQRQAEQQKAEAAVREQQQTALGRIPASGGQASGALVTSKGTGEGVRTVVLRGMGELVQGVKELTSVVHQLTQQEGKSAPALGACGGCDVISPSSQHASVSAAVSLMESAPTSSLEERRQMQPGVTALCNSERVFRMTTSDGTARCFPQRVIIDSGAQPVLVGARVANALGLKGEKLTPCPFAIQTSLGGQDQAEGATRDVLLLTLFPGVPGKEAIVRVKVVVTAAMTYDVLLGAAFLATLGFVIDYRQPSCYYYPGMSEHDHRKVALPVVFYGRCPIVTSTVGAFSHSPRQSRDQAEQAASACGSAFAGFFWVDPWHEVTVVEHGFFRQVVIPANIDIGTVRQTGYQWLADTGEDEDEDEPPDLVETQREYQPGLTPQREEDLQALFERERHVQELELAQPGFLALPRTSGDFREMMQASSRVMPAFGAATGRIEQQVLRQGRPATAQTAAERQRVLTLQRRREPIVVPRDEMDPWQVLREAPMRFWLQVGLHVQAAHSLQNLPLPGEQPTEISPPITPPINDTIVPNFALDFNTVRANPLTTLMTMPPIRQRIVRVQPREGGAVVVELFAGLGSLTAALVRSGEPVSRVHLVENQRDVRQVARAHLERLSERYPHLLPRSAIMECFTTLPQDVRQLTPADWDRIGPVDYLLGSPPCQGWSRAGHRQGVKDVRSFCVIPLKIIIDQLQRRNPNMVYFIENVQPPEQDEELMLQFREVCRIFGKPVMIDAARLGARAHRPRLFWTNMVSTAVLEVAQNQWYRPSSILVQDILEPGWEPMPVLRTEQPLVVNVAGQPRRALPTLVSFPGSYAFRNGGPGLLRFRQAETSYWREPNANERERALGFSGDDTKLFREQGALYTPQELEWEEKLRRQVLGACIDSLTLTWLLCCGLAAQFPDLQAMGGTPPTRRPLDVPHWQQVTVWETSGGGGREANPDAEEERDENGMVRVRKVLTTGEVEECAEAAHMDQAGWLSMVQKKGLTEGALLHYSRAWGMSVKDFVMLAESSFESADWELVERGDRTGQVRAQQAKKLPITATPKTRKEEGGTFPLSFTAEEALIDLKEREVAEEAAQDSKWFAPNYNELRNPYAGEMVARPRQSPPVLGKTEKELFEEKRLVGEQEDYWLGRIAWWQRREKEWEAAASSQREVVGKLYARVEEVLMNEVGEERDRKLTLEHLHRKTEEQLDELHHFEVQQQRSGRALAKARRNLDRWRRRGEESYKQEMALLVKALREGEAFVAQTVWRKMKRNTLSESQRQGLDRLLQEKVSDEELRQLQEAREVSSDEEESEHEASERVSKAASQGSNAKERRRLGLEGGPQLYSEGTLLQSSVMEKQGEWLTDDHCALASSVQQQAEGVAFAAVGMMDEGRD